MLTQRFHLEFKPALRYFLFWVQAAGDNTWPETNRSRALAAKRKNPGTTADET